MKFLADENVEWPIVLYLRQNKHDVVSVRETFPGENDDKILEFALKENRILLTNDLDFGRMAIHQKKKTSGILLMRFASESSEEKVSGLEHLLAFHSEKLPRHFTVINEKQIKIRPIS